MQSAKGRNNLWERDAGQDDLRSFVAPFQHSTGSSLADITLDERRGIEKNAHQAQPILKTSFALFDNHATDRNAIQYQGLRLASLPRWEIGRYRHNVGDGLAVAKH